MENSFSKSLSMRLHQLSGDRPRANWLCDRSRHPILTVAPGIPSALTPRHARHSCRCLAVINLLLAKKEEPPLGKNELATLPKPGCASCFSIRHRTGSPVVEVDNHMNVKATLMKAYLPESVNFDDIALHVCFAGRSTLPIHSGVRRMNTRCRVIS